MSLTRGCVLDVANQLGGAMPGVVTLHDYSRAKTDGTFTNAPTWTQLPTGLWVLNFVAASTQYIQSANTVGENYISPNGTITAWIRPTINTIAIAQIVDTTRTDAYVYLAVYTGNNLIAGVRDNFGGANFAWIKRTDVNSITLNTWIMATVTQNGTMPAIYINGISETLTDIVAPADNTVWTNYASLPTLIDSIAIGAMRDTTPDQYFDGNISKLRIYNYALTPAQIRAIYHSEKWLFGVA